MTTKSHTHTHLWQRQRGSGGNSSCYPRSYSTVDYISSEHFLLASHGIIIYLESQRLRVQQKWNVAVQPLKDPSSSPARKQNKENNPFAGLPVAYVMCFVEPPVKTQTMKSWDTEHALWLPRKHDFSSHLPTSGGFHNGSTLASGDGCPVCLRGPLRTKSYRTSKPDSISTLCLPSCPAARTRRIKCK